MRIKRHDRSDIVELSDGSVWRIWPADVPKTLQGLPTTEIDVLEIEHDICSHTLIDHAQECSVRVIDANAEWPVAAVRRSLGDG